MLAVAYATGRASHARQIKDDDPDKKGYPGPPGWGFGVGLTTPHRKKLTVTKVERRKKLDRFNYDGRKRTRYTEIFKPLNAELNPICYLLALLAHHFLHVSRLRVK